LVFGVAGALWGLFRPTLAGHEVDDGGYAIEAMGSAQFIAFITFALITGLLGLLLGLGAYLRRQERGLSMLLWVGV